MAYLIWRHCHVQITAVSSAQRSWTEHTSIYNTGARVLLLRGTCQQEGTILDTRQAQGVQWYQVLHLLHCRRLCCYHLVSRRTAAFLYVGAP